MEKYDLIIVGGSISGIAAANAAIENGLKPLILDRTLDMGSKMVGSLIISESTYKRYFQQYDSLINGKYDRITWSDSIGRSEETFRLTEQVVSLDREKLIKSLATDAIYRGATLKIKSTVVSMENMGDYLIANCSKEGKIEKVQAQFIALGHRNLDDPLIVHASNCQIKKYYGVYAKGPITKDEESTLKISGDINSFSFRLTWGKRWEKFTFLEGKSREEENALNYSRVIGRTHNCFPKVPENVLILANLLGTNNILGMDSGNTFRFSYETTTDMIDHGWEDGVKFLEKKWKNYITAVPPDDRLKKFMNRIPMGM